MAKVTPAWQSSRSGFVWPPLGAPGQSADQAFHAAQGREGSTRGSGEGNSSRRSGPEARAT
eukprot:15439141-Alexandrium_andersonii.AAC.1